MSDLEILRPLGIAEKYASARNHLGYYHSVGISASYKCPSSAGETIFSALNHVIQRHPSLSAIPMNEGSSSPFFSRLPMINLEKAVTFMARKKPFIPDERDTELEDILETQHNTAFKRDSASLPFWRLIILSDASAENEFVASFIYHHALADGQSGVAFHTDFLFGLSAGFAPLKSKLITSPKEDLLPTMEQLYMFRTSESVSTAPSRSKNLWTGEKIQTPLKSCFQSLTFSRETTRQFLHACKAQGTTVTGTVPVLVATAIMRNIPDHFEELQCEIPISTRRWMPLPIDQNSMGIWVDALSQSYHRDKVSRFSWDEARRSRGTMTEYLQTTEQNNILANYNIETNMVRIFSSKIGMERTSSFSVSNLGVVRTESDNGVRRCEMGRMVFSRSAFVAGCAISTGVITGPDGCLVIGFSWQEGIVETNVVEAIMKAVRVELELALHT